MARPRNVTEISDTLLEDMGVTRAEIDQMSPAERATLLRCIEEYAETGTSPTAQGLVTDDYKWEPVSMQQFIDDPFYLGKIGGGIFPKLRELVLECIDTPAETRPTEVILGGCIDLDAMVQEADGGLPTLRERLGKKTPVCVVKDGGAVTASCTDGTRHSGVKRVLQLDTTDGSRLRLTPDHRVRVMRDLAYCWVAAADLRVGDFVVTPRVITVKPSAHLSPDAARLLAYWCADGSASETRARFCDGNPMTSLDALAIMRHLGFDGKRYKKGPNCWEVHAKKTKSSGFLAWLRMHGADKRTADVTVPDEVCRSSNATVAAFLNALWACEGSVVCHPAVSPPRIQLAVTSERFIRQVAALLRRFGIHARVYSVDYVDKRYGARRHIWHLAISGTVFLRAFLDHVGDILGKELVCRALRTYCDRAAANTNVDIVPLTGRALSRMVTASGWKRGADDRRAWRTAGLQCMSHAYVMAWCDEYAHLAVARKIRALFQYAAFTRVKSVSPVAVPCEVGDIGAFNGNRFISSNLSVHNSLGWGKTTGAALLAIYLLYRLTCLRDPHKYYGIMQGTELVIGVYSINIEQAMDGIYGRLLRWVDAIPYFEAKCPRVKRVTAEIRFASTPIKVIAGSKEVHTMGRDMYCFVLDEANFFSKAGSENKDDATVAQGIYTNAARRIKNRFMTARGEPAGLAILASSKRTKASFLEAHIKESKKEIAEGKTKHYAYAVWDVLPSTKYKKPKFAVEIGDRIHPSRIIRDGEEARRGAEVIMVPGELRADFELDVDKALRDHAGVASESMMPLFRDRTVIRRAASAEHKHPFTRPEITLNINDDIGIDTYFVPERMFSIQRSAYTLRLNPTAPRYLHVDIGFTEDSLGLCMLHIAGARTVKRARADGTWYEDRAPVCLVDFLLRVNPPQGEGEIDLPKVRSFILALRDLGVPIARISYDSHQSRESVQVFKKLGFDAIWQSVDKTDQPYLDLRQAITEQRISYYEYPTLFRELGELERDLDEAKVDHPKTSAETGERGCFAGDTRVALLDGTNPTLRELAERGEDTYVYTIKDGAVAVGHAVKPRLTNRAARTVVVTLDSGERLTCTPDHRFMLRTGEYRRADQLCPHDSLMPLYRRISTKKDGKLAGYEMYHGVDDGRWHFTHRMVGRFIDPAYTGNQFGKRVVHHCAGKTNNDPRKLSVITPWEHTRIHADDIKRRRSDPAFERRRVLAHLRYARSPAARSAQSARMRALWERDGFAAAQRVRVAEIGRKTGTTNITKYNKSAQHRATAARIGRETIRLCHDAVRRDDVDVAAIKAAVADNTVLCARHVAERLGCSVSLIERRLARDAACSPLRAELARRSRRVMSAAKSAYWAERRALHNHKVASVTTGPVTAVYDLSVPGTENFALTAGVFVHNSKDVSDALAGAYFTAMNDKRYATVRNLPEGAPAAAPVSSGRSAPTVTQRVQIPGGSMLWSTLDKELR